MEENFINHPLAVITFVEPSSRKEILLEFAQSGHDIFLHTTPEDFEEAKNDLEGFDVKLYLSSADLSTYTGVEEFCREIRSIGRPIDILMIGVAGENYLSESSDADLVRQFSLIRSNTLAQVHLLSRIKNDMIQRGSGKIIITAVTGTDTSIQAEAALKASHAFMQSYGKSLKKELEGTGVEVIVNHSKRNLPFKAILQVFAGRYLPQYVLVNLQK